MSNTFVNWFITKISQWLLKNKPIHHKDYYTDFNKICKNIQIGDVILIQGRNKISNVIRYVTLSPWTHAALYIGRLQDIKDPEAQKIVAPYCTDCSEKQLLIESMLGHGTVLANLEFYQDYVIRLLRPSQLTDEDAHRIVSFAIGRLGRQYDVRHLLDLARFIFPWGLLPRRWRSSLFEHNALQPTKDICSSMIAETFQSVDYPILPLIETGYENKLEFIPRNNMLYTPNDFDYSPYFDVIKYPYVPLMVKGEYHHLPWMKNSVSDDEGLNFISLSPKIQKFFTSPSFAVIGASANRNKFGNKVLRAYLQKNKKVYPVHPHEKMIEGIACVDQIANLPSSVKSISIVTPPAVTEKIVDEAIAKGIQNIWMQPGAESALAVQKCEEHNINVIADGSCILRELGFQDI